MLRLLAAATYPLKGWDIGFFVACGVIVALIVAIYFLIPVINKKQYQEQRDNLKKREVAFKANQGVATEEAAAEPVAEAAPVEEAAAVAEAPAPKKKSAKK